MSYGKFQFKTVEEFKAVCSLAHENGFKTVEEFKTFLDLFYQSNLKK
jgi:hypothetical protein